MQAAKVQTLATNHNGIIAGSSADSKPDENHLLMQSVNLDEILALWGKLWAAEQHSTLNWVEYTEEGLRNSLAKSDPDDHHHKHFLGKAKHSKLLSKGHHLTFKDIKQTDITEHKYFSHEEHLDNDSAGWEVVFSNETSIPQSGRASIAKTLTSQRQDTWTTGVTLSLGVEFGGGIPAILATKVTLTAALNKSRTEQTTEIKSETRTIEEIVTCPPGKHIYGKVKTYEDVTVTQITAKVYVQGEVVICCKNKVPHPGIAKRTGEHFKWAIPIHQVLQDLERYKTQVPADSEEFSKITAAIDSFKERRGNDVGFEIKGELIERNITNAVIVAREEEIPDWKPPVTSGGQAPSTHETAQRPNREFIQSKVSGKLFALNVANIKIEDSIKLLQEGKDRDTIIHSFVEGPVAVQLPPSGMDSTTADLSKYFFDQAMLFHTSQNDPNQKKNTGPSP